MTCLNAYLTIERKKIISINNIQGMIMKKFAQYLAESERTYNYRIKVVGEMPEGFYNSLKSKLDQFDPVSISDIKSTPIQAKPADFPAFENDKVSSVDVKFRYPAIEPQIKQLAQLMGFDPNRIIMQTSVYDDSNAKYQEQLAQQPDSLLADTDYPADDKEQKELKADYSADPYDHAVLKNAYRSNFTVAGGKLSQPKQQTISKQAITVL
jgi:hypothetical protein